MYTKQAAYEKGSKVGEAKRIELNKNKQTQRDVCNSIYWSNMSYVIKKGKRDRGKICIWRNNGWKVPKFSKTHKFTDAKTIANLKQYKLKESYAQIHHNQTVENRR